MNTRRERGLLLIILSLAAWLRFYHLDNSSLWSDEGNTWALLGRSFAQIGRDAAADIHPPGYYWLLKLWSMVVGTSAWGMRSFSALLGILLVYVIYQLGRALEDEAKPGARSAHVALIAALLAAVNPFQIYYSQEARMYVLLALESAGLFWALYGLSKRPTAMSWRAALVYVLCGIAGVWTHYSFPIIWGAAGLGFLAYTGGVSQNIRAWRAIVLRFMGLNLLILLTFLPWLPIAIDRVLHWPKGGEIITVAQGMILTLRTLVFGPLRDLALVQWPWLLAAGVLPIIGVLGQWRRARQWPITLWLLAPILLMFGLGLFSDAFLKFLLTASPAWCLLAAIGIGSFPAPRYATSLLLGGALALAALTLPTYYTSPTARDNYAGIAQYLQAVAEREQTLVILDAPGQQEVWRYYDSTLPMIALPQQRPQDSAATVQTLQTATAGRSSIYALFWATDEADPDGVVERWLDQHAFKGLDSWRGNLRFVSYSLPGDLPCADVTPAPIFGTTIHLVQLCQPTLPQTVAAGDVALLSLHWQPLTRLTQRYKVTVQVLDQQNQVIAQRDSEPVGGSQPTDQWVVGQTVVDNHGVLIPPGTPPGTYRLIVALYDANGRLGLPDGVDYFVLGELVVDRPARPLPLALLPLDHPVNRQVGPIQLVGYSAYRQGMGHARTTPVVAGDRVEFTFFWQAPEPLPADWPADLQVTLSLGEQSLTLPLAGTSYPTGQWQPGELVRSQAELIYTGGNPIPQIQIGEHSIRLQALPGTAWWQVYR